MSNISESLNEATDLTQVEVRTVKFDGTNADISTTLNVKQAYDLGDGTIDLGGGRDTFTFDGFVTNDPDGPRDLVVDFGETLADYTGAEGIVNRRLTVDYDTIHLLKSIDKYTVEELPAIEGQFNDQPGLRITDIETSQTIDFYGAERVKVDGENIRRIDFFEMWQDATSDSSSYFASLMDGDNAFGLKTAINIASGTKVSDTDDGASGPADAGAPSADLAIDLGNGADQFFFSAGDIDGDLNTGIHLNVFMGTDASTDTVVLSRALKDYEVTVHYDILDGGGSNSENAAVTFRDTFTGEEVTFFNAEEFRFKNQTIDEDGVFKKFEDTTLTFDEIVEADGIVDSAREEVGTTASGADDVNEETNQILETIAEDAGEPIDFEDVDWDGIFVGGTELADIETDILTFNRLTLREIDDVNIDRPGRPSASGSEIEDDQSIELDNNLYTNADIEALDKSDTDGAEVVENGYILGGTNQSRFRDVYVVEGDADPTLTNGEILHHLGDTGAAGRVTGPVGGPEDPVQITGHGRVNNGTVGELNNAIRFSNELGFGLDNGPDGAGQKRLNSGDSVTFSLNGEQTIGKFVFTVNGAGTHQVALDFDGDILKSGDYNRSEQIEDMLLTFDAQGGDTVVIDFANGTLTVGGTELTGDDVDLFLFLGQNKTAITVGSLDGFGFSAQDVEIHRTEATALDGGAALELPTAALTLDVSTGNPFNIQETVTIDGQTQVLTTYTSAENVPVPDDAFEFISISAIPEDGESGDILRLRKPEGLYISGHRDVKDGDTLQIELNETGFSAAADGGLQVRNFGVDETLEFTFFLNGQDVFDATFTSVSNSQFQTVDFVDDLGLTSTFDQVLVTADDGTKVQFHDIILDVFG